MNSNISFGNQIKVKERKDSKFKDLGNRLPENTNYEITFKNKIKEVFDGIDNFLDKENLNLAFSKLSCLTERVALLDLIMKHKRNVKLLRYKIGLNAVIPFVKNFKKRKNSNIQEKAIEESIINMNTEPRKVHHPIIPNHYKKLKLAKNLHPLFESKRNHKSANTLDSNSFIELQPSDVKSKYIEFLGKMSKILKKKRSEKLEQGMSLTSRSSIRDPELKKHDIKMSLFQEYKEKKISQTLKLQKHLQEKIIKDRDKESINDFERHLKRIFQKDPTLQLNTNSTFRSEVHLNKLRTKRFASVEKSQQISNTERKPIMRVQTKTCG